MQIASNNEVQDVINSIINKYPGLYEDFGAEAIKAALEFIVKYGGRIKKIKDSEANFIGELGKEYVKSYASKLKLEKSLIFPIMV